MRGREAGEGGRSRVRVCVCVHVHVRAPTPCVSVADLLVWKQIFSLSDSINLPHLS